MIILRSALYTRSPTDVATGIMCDSSGHSVGLC